MPHALALPDDQPDLFVGTAEELLTEIDQHGGGAPPRYPAPPTDADVDEDAAGDFSPVKVAERLRVLEREHGIVQIRQVSLSYLATLLL